MLRSLRIGPGRKGAHLPHWGRAVIIGEDDVSDLLEKRVGEVETLVWEIPNLLNVRFQRFETELASLRGAIVDNTTRLQAIERAMTMLQTGMRDLRGGVTRQLIAQDQRISEMKADVAEIKADVAGIKHTLDVILLRLPPHGAS